MIPTLDARLSDIRNSNLIKYIDTVKNFQIYGVQI